MPLDTFTNPPIIHETEYVVLGGTTAALAAAAHLAACGHQVLLVSKDTHLYTDIASSGCYYLDLNLTVQDSLYPTLFPPEVESENASCAGLRILHPDRLKHWGERLCEKEGIRLLYTLVPLDLQDTPKGRILRLGGKAGTTAVRCLLVIDLRHAPICGLSKHPEDQEDRDNGHGCFMDILHAPHIDRVVNLEAQLSEDHHRAIITLRPGAFGPGHTTLELRLPKLAEPTFWDDGTHMRSLLLESFKWVKTHILGYEQITPGRCADTPYRQRVQVDAEVSRGVRLAREALFGDTSCPYRPQAGPGIELPEGLLCHADNPILDYRAYPQAESVPPTLAIDNLMQSDIIVVGGGTAGIMAALSAASLGLHVTVVESNPHCGGTATTGGVWAYWYGRRYRDVQRMDDLTTDLYRKLGLQREPGIWSSSDRTHPDLRTLVLSRECSRLGITVLTDTQAFAVIKEGQRVRGVLATDGVGIKALLGACIIDATGDGDIAVFAGAEHTYGSAREAISFWASLAQYKGPDAYANNFSSTVVLADPFDITRFILEGRQRGGALFDHGTYLAPRESRHILGELTIDLKNILEFQEYPDTLYTCFSNYDPKGRSCADLLYAGFLPPPLMMSVPLRALLPVDTHQQRILGLIVAGKAISATHDALPGMRMQTDLMHQGTVIGLAAATAVCSRVDFSALDIDGLQCLITQQTGDPLSLASLHETDPERLVAAIQPEHLKEWTHLPFSEEVTSQPILIGAALMEEWRIVPYLAKRFTIEPSSAVRLQLAQLLLWHGSDLGTDLVLEEIQQRLDQVDSRSLPVRSGSMQCVQMLPDHAVMAELVHLLNLLAWSKNRDIHTVFANVLSRLQQAERDYRTHQKSIYHYVESLAYVAERTVLPEFIPMLRDLIGFPEFRTAREPHDAADIGQERLALLLLSLYRALARCGAVDGYAGLVALLDYPSLAVALSACMELKTLTGLNLPLQAKQWEGVISSRQFRPDPQPIVGKVW